MRLVPKYVPILPQSISDPRGENLQDTSYGKSVFQRIAAPIITGAIGLTASLPAYAYQPRDYIDLNPKTPTTNESIHAWSEWNQAIAYTEYGTVAMMMMGAALLGYASYRLYHADKSKFYAMASSAGQYGRTHTQNIYTRSKDNTYRIGRRASSIKDDILDQLRKDTQHVLDISSNIASRARHYENQLAIHANKLWKAGKTFTINSFEGIGKATLWLGSNMYSTGSYLLSKGTLIAKSGIDFGINFGAPFLDESYNMATEAWQYSATLLSNTASALDKAFSLKPKVYPAWTLPGPKKVEPAAQNTPQYSADFLAYRNSELRGHLDLRSSSKPKSDVYHQFSGFDKRNIKKRGFPDKLGDRIAMLSLDRDLNLYAGTPESRDVFIRTQMRGIGSELQKRGKMRSHDLDGLLILNEYGYPIYFEPVANRRFIDYDEDMRTRMGLAKFNEFIRMENANPTVFTWNHSGQVQDIAQMASYKFNESLFGHDSMLNGYSIGDTVYFSNGGLFDMRGVIRGFNLDGSLVVDFGNGLWMPRGWPESFIPHRHLFKNRTNPIHSSNVHKQIFWNTIDIFSNPNLPNNQFEVLFANPPGQANVGNCYLVATLYTAHTHGFFRPLMQKAIKPGKSRGSYELAFPFGKLDKTKTKKETIRWHEYNLPHVQALETGDDRQMLQRLNGDAGYKILEEAFVRYASNGKGLRGIEGGYSATAMDFLFGDAIDPKIFSRDRTQYYMSIVSQELGEFDPELELGVAASYNAATTQDINGNVIEIHESHAYAIKSTTALVNPINKHKELSTITLVNPHNPNEEIILTARVFLSTFYRVTIGKLKLQTLAKILK